MGRWTSFSIFGFEIFLKSPEIHLKSAHSLGFNIYPIFCFLFPGGLGAILTTPPAAFFSPIDSKPDSPVFNPNFGIGAAAFVEHSYHNSTPMDVCPSISSPPDHNLLVASTNSSNPCQYQQNSSLSINDSLNSLRLTTGMSPDISPGLSTINLEQLVNLLRPQLPIQHNPTIVNSCHP